MERTMISWNLPNWITIVLMAALGYLVFGLAAQLVLNQFGGGGGSATIPNTSVAF